ncbi:COX15/CtaA family protein [Balneolales bacterium ANBcel1]|nr:COX15/CtaA family protein [Balneolales bacterium ANBcel1]
MTWSTLFSRLNVFQKTALITIAVTFLLIFIGGLVRATGAGLGCPDWPKCFGLWIPPLSAADLPAPYDPAEFNVFKTWMEYVNRLVGVVVGFLILLTFLFSFRYLSRSTPVFLGALLAFVLVLFQGWLGGRVVLSGLEGYMITLHMVTALVILNVLVWTYYRSVRDRITFTLEAPVRRKLTVVLVLFLLVMFIQIVLGTQVREGLEAVKAAYPGLERGSWIDRVGWVDDVHRSFSWVVLILAFLFQLLVRRFNAEPYLRLLALLTTASVVLQIAVGAGLVYLAIPPAFQVLHLWIAAFSTVVLFVALLLVADASKRKTV